MLSKFQHTENKIYHMYEKMQYSSQSDMDVGELSDDYYSEMESDMGILEVDDDIAANTEPNIKLMDIEQEGGKQTIPGFHQVAQYDRHIEKFKTDKYITKFVLEDAIDLPTERLGQTFDQLIDQSFEASKKYYKQEGYEPYKFQLHLFSDMLDTPLSISLRERDRMNDSAEMLNEIEKLDV